MNEPAAGGQRRVLLLGLLGVLALFNLLCLLNVFREARPGLVASGSMLIVLAVTLRESLRLLFRRENTFFLVYMAIVFASLLHYVFDPFVVAFSQRYPDTLLGTASYLLIPSVFFYVGGNALGSEALAGNKVLERIVVITAVCILFGILFYVLLPGFYVAYLFRTFENNVTLLPRMSGYLGNPMTMGALCATTLPLAAGLRRPLWVRMVLVGICLIGSFLTLQRGSWLTCAIVLALLALSHLHTHGVRILVAYRVGVLVVVTCLALILTALIRYSDVLRGGFIGLGADMITREFSLESMVGDRSEQWVNVGKVLEDRPMGMGIGMLSHVTAVTGFDLAIPDGNYFRILGELGPFGLLVFLGLLGGALRRALRRGETFVAVAIVASALLGVGTNVFDLYYSGYLFWLLLGITYATPLYSRSPKRP